VGHKQCDKLSEATTIRGNITEDNTIMWILIVLIPLAVLCVGIFCYVLKYQKKEFPDLDIVKPEEITNFNYDYTNIKDILRQWNQNQDILMNHIHKKNS
jgi:hypothetical protein